MMKKWVSHAGLPMIFVRVRSWDASGLKIEIRQDSFPDQSHKLWPIPLTFTSSANPNEVMSLVLDKKLITIVVENVSPKDGWVQFNLKGVGYYIVQYEKKLYENLIQYRLNDMASIDRQLLVHTQFLLAEHGYCDTRDYIEVFDIKVQIKI